MFANYSSFFGECSFCEFLSWENLYSPICSPGLFQPFNLVFFSFLFFFPFWSSVLVQLRRSSFDVCLFLSSVTSSCSLRSFISLPAPHFRLTASQLCSDAGITTSFNKYDTFAYEAADSSTLASYAFFFPFPLFFFSLTSALGRNALFYIAVFEFGPCCSMT